MKILFNNNVESSDTIEIATKEEAVQHILEVADVVEENIAQVLSTLVIKGTDPLTREEIIAECFYRVMRDIKDVSISSCVERCNDYALFTVNYNDEYFDAYISSESYEDFVRSICMKYIQDGIEVECILPCSLTEEISDGEDNYTAEVLIKRALDYFAKESSNLLISAMVIDDNIWCLEEEEIRNSYTFNAMSRTSVTVRASNLSEALVLASEVPSSSLRVDDYEIDQDGSAFIKRPNGDGVEIVLGEYSTDDIENLNEDKLFEQEEN